LENGDTGFGQAGAARDTVTMRRPPVFRCQHFPQPSRLLSAASLPPARGWRNLDSPDMACEGCCRFGRSGVAQGAPRRAGQREMLAHAGMR
jgi:hypothetical protein